MLDDVRATVRVCFVFVCVAVSFVVCLNLYMQGYNCVWERVSVSACEVYL